MQFWPTLICMSLDSGSNWLWSWGSQLRCQLCTLMLFTESQNVAASIFLTSLLLILTLTCGHHSISIRILKRLSLSVFEYSVLWKVCFNFKRPKVTVNFQECLKKKLPFDVGFGRGWLPWFRIKGSKKFISLLKGILAWFWLSSLNFWPFQAFVIPF